MKSKSIKFILKLTLSGRYFLKNNGHLVLKKMLETNNPFVI